MILSSMEVADPMVPLRVLVIDDALVYRKTVSDCLTDLAGVEVVGVAANGKIGLDKIERLRPDLIILDLEMPVLDGLAVLEQLQQMDDPPEVLILSGKSVCDAKATTSALRLGAFDFVTKPQGGDRHENRQKLQTSLTQRVHALLRSRHSLQRGTPSIAAEAHTRAENARNATRPALPDARVFPPSRVDIVAIGVSTGGPQALTKLLSNIPADFSVPILIVQHMPATFTRSLAADLDRHCLLGVCEASEGQIVTPGRVYLAPGGQQMKIARQGDDCRIRVTDDPPENSCKPSVDYLFRSVAEGYGSHALGVIMTGMGYDGTVGSRILKGRGAGLICQDEASCVVFGMPREPIEQGLADRVVSLHAMADTLVSCVKESRIR